MLLKGRQEERREEGEKWRRARPHWEKTPRNSLGVGWPKGIFHPWCPHSMRWELTMPCNHQPSQHTSAEFLQHARPCAKSWTIAGNTTSPRSIELMCQWEQTINKYLKMCSRCQVVVTAVKKDEASEGTGGGRGGRGEGCVWNRGSGVAFS